MAVVTIPDSTYSRLNKLAAAMHIPLDQFLDRIADVGTNGTVSGTQGSAEWMKAFDAWVSSHPRRDFIADDSRDAVYGDERD